MYKIVGADGQEYGPVTAETIRQWIAQRRANAFTRVQMVGSTEWRELGTMPEFAAAFAPPPPGALPPPGAETAPPPVTGERFGGQNEADALAAEVLNNDRRFEISECFSQAWNLVAANFWLSVGASALILIITTVAGFIPFASLLLGYVFVGGLDWLFLKLVRNQRAELEDLFVGFSSAFVPLMLFSLISQLLVSLGLILCIIPGVFLLVIWMPYAALLILDKRLDFWPAMEVSRKVIMRNWWQMFGFLLLCLLINLVGVLLCFVGVFFTMALTTAAVVVAYEQVFGPGRIPANSLTHQTRG